MVALSVPSMMNNKQDSRCLLRGPLLLFHNLILVHIRDERDTCFFEVNLTGTVDIADSEDLAVELSCLPVHTAGVIDFNNPGL